MTQSHSWKKHWGLKPGIVFLNHGSFGACPLPILRRQTELRSRMEAEPVQFLWRRYEELLEPARQALARFVGARAGDLAFVHNATSGVNAVVRSLDWKRGDEILTTDYNYNACHNVLVAVAERYGAKVVRVSLPLPLRCAADVVEPVLGAVTHRTRLAMLDHVTSDTALVMPIEKLVRALEARGVDTLVDGAHAPGMVPLSLRRLRPAYYTANLHKWVCAPKGAAFLWVREDRQSQVQPVIISHGNNRPREGWNSFQDRFDWPGTLDPTAWMCVGEAIGWMNDLVEGGWPEIRRRNHALAVEARRILCRAWGVEPLCPESWLGSMATVLLPECLQGVPPAGKIDAEQLELYDRHGIEVPFNRNRVHGEPRRCLRISAHVYNDVEDYKALVRALE